MNIMFFMLTRLLYLVPTALILGGCVVYLGRSRSLDGVLMLVGNIGILAVGLISALGAYFMIRGGMAEAAKLLLGVQLLGWFFALVFAAGFLMMALRRPRPSPAA